MYVSLYTIDVECLYQSSDYIQLRINIKSCISVSDGHTSKHIRSAEIFKGRCKKISRITHD